jgi:hypothetical protein
MNDPSQDFKELAKPENYMPLLKEALRPLEMCVALLIRAGSSSLMLDTCRIVSDMMFTACEQYRLFNDGRGTVH